MAEVANGLAAVRTNENPVMAVESMGLTPISPVTTEIGTVEIPDFAKITKLPAVPRSTGVRPAIAWWSGKTMAMARAKPIPNCFVAFTKSAAELIFIFLFCVFDFPSCDTRHYEWVWRCPVWAAPWRP
jgi:hypothetical protein